MNPVEVIIKKRNGGELSRAELQSFISSYIADDIDSSQMSALLMAIYFKGMSFSETHDLTDLYIRSGKQLRFDNKLLTVDKHSTGGVGDKISLMLAPIIAACGGHVPMISGRGLGHTGGTLDKLESIPGFKTNYGEDQFREFISNSGLAIISQSEKLVPADRLIYALRDTTGTVESLPLITASIMSKKIAEGADHLVIDLKVGSGAFMQNIAIAKELGELLQKTGESFGQKVKIVYTNMNSPLGNFCGNALEIKETISYLKGENVPDIDVITRKLASEMLLLNGLYSKESVDFVIDDALKSGRALQKFEEMIIQQNGDPNVIDDPDLLPSAKYEIPVFAEESGYISAIDSRKIGYALVSIGAGRKRLEDKLDMAAGAYLPHKIGAFISKGQEIGRIYCSDKKTGDASAQRIREAYILTEKKIEKEELILAEH